MSEELKIDVDVRAKDDSAKKTLDGLWWLNVRRIKN